MGRLVPLGPGLGVGYIDVKTVTIAGGSGTPGSIVREDVGTAREFGQRAEDVKEAKPRSEFDMNWDKVDGESVDQRQTRHKGSIAHETALKAQYDKNMTESAKVLTAGGLGRGMANNPEGFKEELTQALIRASHDAAASCSALEGAEKKKCEQLQKIGRFVNSLATDRSGGAAVKSDGTIAAAAAAIAQDLTGKYKSALEDGVEAAATEAAKDVSKDTFRIVNESGLWNNKNLFEEQIWLLKQWFPTHLKKHANKFRGGPSESLNENKHVRYCYANTDHDSRNYLGNLLAVKGTSLYSQLPPSLYALLVPKIKLMVEYNKYDGKGVVIKDLRFDEHLSPQAMKDLMEGKEGRIPGIGMLSAMLEDKAQSAAELRRNYVLKLKVRSQSIQDFGTKSKDGRATFHDLWYNVSQKDNKKGPNNILRVELGWQIPSKKAIQGAFGRSCSETKAGDIQKALGFNNMTYRLSLSKYSLNFNQDGSIVYDGTYIAAMAADIFGRDAFPIPKDVKITVAAPEKGIGKTKKIDVTAMIKMVKGHEEKLKQLQKSQIETSTKMAKEKTEKKKLLQDAMKKIADKAAEIQGEIQNMKTQLKDARFRGVTTKLMDDEGIQVVAVGLNSDGEFSTAKHENQGKKPSSASQQARGAAKASGVSKSAQRVQLITLQKAVASQNDKHLIPYVHFGQIIETFVTIILENSKSPAQNFASGLPLIGGVAGAFRTDNTDFQIHMGPAAIRYTPRDVYMCNIGELPITMNRFGQFMQKIYARLPWDGAPVPFSELFEMICQELLSKVLNNYDFLATSENTPGARSTTRSFPVHVPRLKTFAADYKFMAKYAEKGNIILLGNAKLQGGVSLPLTATSFGGYSNAIRNLKKKDRAMDIYYLYIQQYSPMLLNGTIKQNNDNGIYHFFIGSDTGILKTINFSEDDIQGRQEAVMLSAPQGRTRQIFKFDSNLKLVGNSLFSNGDLIYIDPKFAGSGAKSLVNAGIGGYYNVTKVNHSISRSGFETELSAKWNCFPNNRGDSTRMTNYFAQLNHGLAPSPVVVKKVLSAEEEAERILEGGQSAGAGGGAGEAAQEGTEY